MSQKTYLYILKTGIFLAFICFFFVFKHLLFPFITSKQISFNILIEVLFVLWLAFIVKYPTWNPFKKKNKNLIIYGLVAFFVVMTVSCFTGVDFNLSFWGDVERMLGVFHILHFLAFYFIIITVMRNWKDWQLLITVCLVASTMVFFKGLSGNSHSTIGNSTYVSGLAIFNIYFVFLLFFKEKKYTGWRWLYLIPIPIILRILYRTNTTGAYIGLGISVLCFLFLMGILNKRKKIKIISLAVLILSLASIALIFVNRDNEMFANSRVLSGMTVGKNTFQTRLISWRAAGLDFKDHWLLGTGHGNFAIIFDKHFDPKFYDFTRGETYFDRAHNNVIDIASTTGSLGILAYLSIFVGMAIYLIKALRRERIGNLEFSLLSCLFIAYFIQNLAVFDSFVTYMALMVFLGYIHFLANTKEEEGNKEALLNKEGDRGFENKETGVLVVSGIVIFVIMYQFNIVPLKMLVRVIDGQILFGQGKIVEAVDKYREAMAYDTVLDRDGRDTLTRSVISRVGSLAAMDQEKIEEIVGFVSEQQEKNIALNPEDSLSQMQAARLYDVGFRLLNENEKKTMYLQKALVAIEKSLAASPGRIPVYFIKSQFLANQGKFNEAIEVLEYAASLNEAYFETYCQLSQIYLIADQKENGFEAMDICLSNEGGVKFLGYRKAVEEGINHYAEIKDIEKLTLLYEQMTRFEKNNSKLWITLAKLYVEVGNTKKAKQAAQEAAKIDKSLEKDVEEFIRSLGLEE